jgi:thymidylate synthase
MNKLDKQYTDLLQDIIDNGVTKQDRTGTGTLSVFGRQIRHKMSEGFPLLTTKKMPFKTITTELLWFLRGDTNIKFLVENNCHIWDGDAYKNWKAKGRDFWEEQVDGMFTSELGEEEVDKISKEWFINKIKTDDEFAKKWGELGPVYGKQWRSWETYFDKSKGWMPHNYDQIANLIHDLKTNPDSRRLMVNAWNVGELDSMVLPPCHYGFQVYTRELSVKERLFFVNKSDDEYNKALSNKEQYESIGLDFELALTSRMDELNVPTRAISLMWNQRSVDTFLGLPFNITSYGLLLEIIAKEVNMVPDELIGNLGDTHLYLNHIEQAKEQIGRELSLEERIQSTFKLIETTDGTNAALLWELSCQGKKESEILKALNDSSRNIPTRTRQPFELPKLGMDYREGEYDKNLKNFVPDDFYLIDYQSHPSIKAPLSN